STQLLLSCACPRHTPPNAWRPPAHWHWSRSPHPVTNISNRYSKQTKTRPVPGCLSAPSPSRKLAAMSAVPITMPKEVDMLLDATTKKKLREMGAEDLVDTLEAQEGDPAYL